MDEAQSTNIPSFNRDFCVFLEFHLCETLLNGVSNKFERTWCDGVYMPESDWHVSKKHINDSRKIITKAWIVSDHQILFDLTILFGPCSLSRYARGLSLQECVPRADSMDWITLDMENRTIVLQFM
jgi:hypothetical protein